MAPFEPSPACGDEGHGYAMPTQRSNGPHSADRRSGARHPLGGQQVEAVHDGQSFKADLINLSGGGAMVRADFTPQLWDRVDLKLGEGAGLECAVRWIRGDRIGLEFAHETRIEGDARMRDSILLETIRKAFPGDPKSQTRKVPAGFIPRERRHPLIWSGQLIRAGQNLPARLRNIGSGGALVECTGRPAEGTKVVLDLGSGVAVSATIRWVRGDQVGLTFHEPFDLTRLTQAMPDVTPRRRSGSGFLDLVQAQESPWAEGWARPTVERLRGALETSLGA